MIDHVHYRVKMDHLILSQILKVLVLLTINQIFKNVLFLMLLCPIYALLCRVVLRVCVWRIFRSELIQLVTVTQKEAEGSYRELIKEQIYLYKNR